MDNKTKILIVDDHPAMCRGIAQLIANEPDLTVSDEAADSHEALAALRQDTPDLVILDISLRDGDLAGLDLISQIHSLAGPIPILIYSMHDEMEYAIRALQTGARGYLMKQAPVRHVIMALRQLLETGVYVSEQVSRQFLQHHVGRNQATEPPDDSRDAMAGLSHRETEVFLLVGKGLPPRKIAAELNISAKTVESHRRNIRKKLHISSASEMMQFAVDWTRRNCS